MVAEPVSLVGQQVGNYEVLRELGRGGMGVVYRAHEASLNRPVALKVLAPQLASDPAFAQRFLREARAAAGLNHPNVVTVYAVGEHEGSPYIAMEYIRGESLADRIERTGRLSVDEAVAITTAVAGALAAAHRQGLIHRDVKPQNIMLDDTGRPRLLDFGLVKATEGNTALTETGVQLGTPQYMAPEQVQGKPVDGRTDIFALGVVLFEMLTGRAPFQASTPMAVMYQITHEPLPPLRQVCPDVSPALAQLVTNMTAKSPTGRFMRAESVVEELRRVRDGNAPASAPASFVPIDPASILDPPTPSVATPAKRTRPAIELKPILTAGGVLALVIILASLAFFGHRSATPNGPGTVSEAEGWTRLFNGESFDGWVSSEGPKSPVSWVIEDGVMVTRGERNHIQTTAQWTDFEVYLEYRYDAEGNGGLLPQARFELQLCRPYDNMDRSMIHGAITGQYPPLSFQPNPAGQWNRAYLHLEDGFVTAYINDSLVQDGVHATPGLADRLHPGTLREPGPLELQAWSGRVWYRNIYIRPLETPKRSPIPGLNEPPKTEEGWQQVFDGLSYRGWQWEKNTRQAIPWKIENGAVVAVDQIGKMETTARWKDHEVSLEFRCGGDWANGGVFLKNAYEVQIAGSKGDPKWPTGTIIANQRFPRETTRRSLKQWNHYYLRFEENVLTAYLNGKLIHDRVLLVKGKSGASAPGPDDAGGLALQGLRGEVQYRNIYVRAL